VEVQPGIRKDAQEGKKMSEPIIVYVDSYQVIGAYIPKFNRIEISVFMKDFPELQAFVLNHEKQHALIEQSHRFALPFHLWHDIKDRTKAYWDSILFEQLVDFENLATPKSKLKLLELEVYSILTIFAMIPAYVVALRHFVPILRKIIKKIGRSILR
jgi:hypothetical protein